VPSPPPARVAPAAGNDGDDGDDGGLVLDFLRAAWGRAPSATERELIDEAMTAVRATA